MPVAPTARSFPKGFPLDSVAQLTLYSEWLEREHGLDFADYAALHRWSVDELGTFWRSIWDYFQVEFRGSFETVVSGTMPQARWFEGAEVNFARQVFRNAEAADLSGQPAIIAEDELGQTRHIAWSELRPMVGALALDLIARGVRPGDRVAAYLPNAPEAAVAFLACASIGAIWTMCAPDMGTPAVLDRFRQTEPRVLIAADGVYYGGKGMDRSATVAEIRNGLPSLETVYLVHSPFAREQLGDTVDFAMAIARENAEVAAFEPVWVPFEHPLWILYSSGTTGLPKAIVHGHGGAMLATYVGNMHLDLGPSFAGNTAGERFHWYSSTGWVMWNVQVGGLLSGATICLYDGSPRGPQGDWSVLWSFAARHAVTWFGAGAAYYASCRKAGLDLAGCGDLSAIRALGTTGSPLDSQTQLWGTQQFAALGRPDIWWCNISGGTDIAAAFLSGNRNLPPAPGKLQCRHLGAAVEAWDEAGQPVIGEVGELVCTRPFPSMPLFMWGDEDGRRYRETYFSDWEGVWRHGDWLEIDPDGSCTISGRSDATINRFGLRMGTAEIYAAVEEVAGVEDSMVVDLESDGEASQLVMFVELSEGERLDDALVDGISAAIRASLSPRFIPDKFFAAPAIPRTLSGKKQELPIKRLFKGWPVAKVIDPNLTQNPEVLGWYVDCARQWQSDHRQARTG